MNSLAKFGLLILTLAALAGAGCKKKPANITPLPGQSAPSGLTDLGQSPIRPGSGANKGSINPGTPFNTGGGTQSNPNPFGVSDPNGTSGRNGVGSNPDGTGGPGDRPDGSKAEDRETLKSDTVYFEYDRSVVKGSGLASIGAVADYLKSHADNDLVVEGHCDERGTEEYNRALGERRALAIRERLINLGIAGSRITTISYGKDRPAELGHDEASWAKNRRGEFVLLGGPAKVGSLK
jgi:peptidoglycan-associated lipoprotein